MFKAMSSALSLVLILIVLRSALPEVYNLSVELITKILELLNTVLDQAGKFELQ